MINLATTTPHEGLEGGSEHTDTSDLMLVADIGGTNARFALTSAEDGVLQRSLSLPCAAYASLSDAVIDYLSRISCPMPSRAIIAIAAPITDDSIDMTNLAWYAPIDDVRYELELDRLTVLNDYTALALAVPEFEESEREQIGQGFVQENCAMGVLGPGTGLGVSGLVHTGDVWVPVEGEGGHIPFWSSDDRQIKILEIIRDRYKLVSAETIVSGPGLPIIYQAIAELQGYSLASLTPEEINDRASSGDDPLADETIRFFSSALGSVAATTALMLGAKGGIYIGGGVVPKLGKLFDRAIFRKAFEESTEFQEYLTDVPTYLINADYPALKGAMIASRAEYAHLGFTSEA